MGKQRIIMVRSNHIEPDSRVEKEANSLAKAGYHVTLVTWDRSADYWIKEDEKILQDTTVQRISFGARAAFGAGMKSISAYMKFQISLLIWLIKHRKQYDICHFCDFDTAFTGSHVCRMLKKKYIFDIFDYLSTDAASILERLIERSENTIINHADATIICTEQRKFQIRKARPNNLTVIHNSPDKIPDMSLIDLNRSKVKIAYIGILQDNRLLKEMVHAVTMMPEVELHIGGFGKHENFMRVAAEKYENIFFYGQLPYGKALQLENSCDLMTAIYDPAIGNHKFAAPNKFYEGLYLGKPLIMVRGTGMADMVEKEQTGVLIDYSEQGFVKGLHELLYKRQEWLDMGRRMENLYYNRFSWSEMEKRLLGLYKRLGK